MTLDSKELSPSKERKISEELAEDGTSSGVEKEEDIEEIIAPFDPTQVEIQTKSVTLQSFTNRLENEEINLMPDFQRKGGIWNDKQVSRLIESLLLKIPLPVFYFASDEQDDWIVVDGLQRLTAFKKYIIDKKFSLTGMEVLTQFEEFTFLQLPNKMQRRILETECFCHIIKPGTPKDVTRTIFQRINTGGLPLSPQEIRHSLYQGKSTLFLKKLSESKEFQEAIDYGMSNSRMADRECVLRFLAFYLNDPENYTRKNLDDFLCKTMERINGEKEEILEKIEQDFYTAMKCCKEIFGTFAFRKMYESNSSKRRPVNKALFEIWAVELLHILPQQREQAVQGRELIIKEFVNLMNQPFFERAVTQNTGDPKEVKMRFSSVRNIIQKTIEKVM